MGKYLLVLANNVTCEWNFENIIKKFEKKGFKIYLIDNISNENLSVDTLPIIIENIKRERQVDRIVILSNLKEIIFSWYRCYNKLVDAYIYYIDDKNYNFLKKDRHYDFFKELSNFTNIEDEEIEGKIYLNINNNNYLKLYNFLVEDNKFKYFDDINNYKIKEKRSNELQHKVYKYKGKEYSFEISSNIEEEILLDKAKKIKTKTDEKFNKDIVESTYFIKYLTAELLKEINDPIISNNLINLFKNLEKYLGKEKKNSVLIEMIDVIDSKALILKEKLCFLLLIILLNPEKNILLETISDRYINEEFIGECIQYLKLNIEYNQVDSVINLISDAIEILYTKSSVKERNMIINKLEYENNYKENDSFTLYINSTLFYLTQREKYIYKLLGFYKTIDVELKYIYDLFWQLKSISFRFSTLWKDDMEVKLWGMYRDILVRYKKELGFQSEKKSNSNKRNKVIVVTNQFLSVNHAPTRRAIDYIENLLKYDKEILLVNVGINNKDLLENFNGEIIFNYIDEYNKHDCIDIDGNEIGFYQIRNLFDNQEIEELINRIINVEPDMVLSIGSSNILADIIGELYKLVTINCGYGIPTVDKGYIFLGRELYDEDREFLENIKFPESRIQEFYLTYQVPKTKNKRNRKEFNLKKEDVVFIIVGTRIDDEINEKFTVELKMLLESNINFKVIFMGQFNNYENYKNKDEVFINQTVYIGYQDDVLSIYNICDYYLNLERSGGGSSAAQAVFSGLPIITRKYGDVYNAIGDILAYDRIEEIIKFCNEAYCDRVIYMKKRNIALNTAKTLFNTEKMIGELLKITSKM